MSDEYKATTFLTGDVQRQQAKRHIDEARLRELLSYDEKTGIFTRLVAASNSPVGSIVGCASKNGYLRCRLDGQLYYLHRVAFLYMTGSWPTSDIDHIDGCKANNSWANLRHATRKQNTQNISSHTSSISGVRNVYFDKPSGKWQVKIQANGRSHSFGYYADLTEAEAVARNAKRQLHTFCPELRR